MTTNRRAQRRAETRARIIEATIRSVAEHGAAGASVGAVMREAHISRGLVGYHFGNQASLLAAAFERLGDDYREMLGIVAGRPPELTDDVQQQLRDTIRRCFEWPRGYSEREYAYFGFWALARTEPELRAVNMRLNDEVAACLGKLVAAVGRGRGRVVDEQRAGHELSATIDGAWLHLTTEVESFTPAQAITMCEECAERLVWRDWDEPASSGETAPDP